METFEIGGRKFQPAGEGTARKDMYTMRQIAACGVNAIRQLDGEAEEQYICRLYVTACQTGDVFLLLGSLITPEGLDPLKWTEAMAVETANFLGRLTEPEDKHKLRILLASALMPFFVAGRRSLTTFPNSSAVPESDRTRTENADTASTETGDSLSVKLRDTISRQHSGF